jgi:hypothetical protein
MKQGWFQLDEIMQSVLADAISVDANFQLTQTQAWRDFGRSLQSQSGVAGIAPPDLAQGIGRLNNLGVAEISVQLPVELYRPNVFIRLWQFLRGLFSNQKPTLEPKYRLASNKKEAFEIKIVARRDEQGRWATSEE